MSKVMERLEKLDGFLKREQELKNQQNDIMMKSKEFDKEFNEWVQTELGIKDDKRQVHLAEIMKMMLETSMDVKKVQVL